MTCTDPTSKSRNLTILALVLAVVAVGAPSWAADAPSPRDAFYKLPVLRQIELSPDGTHIAMLRNIGGQTLLLIQQIGGGQPRALVQSDNIELKINWFEWATNERLLVSVRVPVKDFYAEFMTSRLLSFDITDGSSTVLVKPKRRTFKDFGDRISQVQDNIVSLLPDDPRHILVALDAEEAGLPGVYRARIDDEKKKLVVQQRQPIRDWMADRQGRVRLGWGIEGTTYKIIVRAVDTDEWRTGWEFEAFEESIVPLGFGLDPNTLYVQATHEGRDAVFKTDLADPALKLELVHADPKYDVDASLIVSPKTRDVVGLAYNADETIHIYFDSVFESYQKAIDGVLPDTANIFVSFSEDLNRYILYSTSDLNPGTYFFGDLAAKQLVPIAVQYPGLDATTLSGREAITYEARDGLTIEGFLTRPQNLADDEVAPAVIFPHGGPYARETGAFDPWAEFLASRGYIVLQMNFRGSAGFGLDFANESLRAWGGEMQDDIIDGARWMISEGLADPDRICIVGASYGGYAALLGGIRHPELFSCAVSFAGVTDLRRVAYESRFYIGSEVAEKQIGDFHKDSDQLEANSPVNLAGKLQIPVLLAHGDSDTVVPFTHAELMVGALDKHDKDYEFLALDHGSHHLGIEANRTTFFKALERFLKTHIGDTPSKRPAQPEAEQVAESEPAEREAPAAE